MSFSKIYSPILCGMDKTGKILVAKPQQGKLHATQNLKLLTGNDTTNTEMKMNYKGITYAAIDVEGSMWTLHEYYQEAKYNCKIVHWKQRK